MNDVRQGFSGLTCHGFGSGERLEFLSLTIRSTCSAIEVSSSSIPANLMPSILQRLAKMIISHKSLITKQVYKQM